jgi:hypothetical protein
MRISKRIAGLLLLVISLNVIAQGKYTHLKSWEGKYPTYNKSSRKFFNLPEVQRPLKKLLNQRDYYLLTKGHTKEVPIMLIGDYLKVKVCGSPQSYACDNHVILVIDLNDGSMYVAFDIFSGEPRSFSTKGKFTDLPQNVQGWFESKTGT